MTSYTAKYEEHPGHYVEVTFFEKEIETKDQNGKSCFRTVDFVTFKQKTHRDSLQRLVYVQDIKKYNRIWDQYQKRKNATSLTELFDKKTSSFIKSHGIESIEALASIPEDIAKNIGQSGEEWRRKAIDFVDSNTSEESSSVDTNLVKALIRVMPQSQKDLLPADVKKTIDALH